MFPSAASQTINIRTLYNLSFHRMRLTESKWTAVEIFNSHSHWQAFPTTQYKIAGAHLSNCASSCCLSVVNCFRGVCQGPSQVCASKAVIIATVSLCLLWAVYWNTFGILFCHVCLTYSALVLFFALAHFHYGLKPRCPGKHL